MSRTTVTHSPGPAISAATRQKNKLALARRKRREAQAAAAKDRGRKGPYIPKGHSRELARKESTKPKVRKGGPRKKPTKPMAVRVKSKQEKLESKFDKNVVDATALGATALAGASVVEKQIAKKRAANKKRSTKSRGKNYPDVLAHRIKAGEYGKNYPADLELRDRSRRMKRQSSGDQ